MAQSIKLLPSAQAMIPESWDLAPHQAPSLGACFFEALPLPLLVFPLSLAVSIFVK